MSESVLIKKIKNNEIWIISINRPNKINACNNDVQNGLYNAFISFENDSISKVAILRGEGDNFCSGADLSSIANGNNNQQLIPTGMNNISEVHLPKYTDNIAPYLSSKGYMGISRLLITKPTIACISGYCVAGGLELALWCDIRICDNTAKFGVFCRRYGVPLIDGGTVRLPKIVGMSNAMDMILTGKEISSKDALRIGLVSRIIDNKTDVLNECIKVAQLLCSFPQECMILDRMNVYKNVQGIDILNGIKSESDRATNSDAFKILRNGAQKFVDGIGKHGSFNEFKSKL